MGCDAARPALVCLGQVTQLRQAVAWPAEQAAAHPAYSRSSAGWKASACTSARCPRSTYSGSGALRLAAAALPASAGAASMPEPR